MQILLSAGMTRDLIPVHKMVCLMLPYRTLSPPLSSPRPLPPQPPQSPPSNDPQDLPGPSQPYTQIPSQLPASQSQSTRVTVDRGCDPIVFSDDSGSDRESEEAGGVAAGQNCKRPAARCKPSLISLAFSLQVCPKVGEHFCTAAILVHGPMYGEAFAHGVSNLSHGHWAIHCHHQLGKWLLWLHMLHKNKAL